MDVGGGELPGHVVAKALGLSRSYLPHRLDSMAARDLINEAGGVGGEVTIRATLDGRAALKRARPAHAASVRRHLLGHLTDASDGPLLRGPWIDWRGLEAFSGRAHPKCTTLGRSGW